MNYKQLLCSEYMMKYEKCSKKLALNLPKDMKEQDCHHYTNSKPLWYTYVVDLAVNTSQGADTVDAFGAASFFSFGAMGIYGFDAFLKFKAWRAGQLGQGERVVQQTESTAYWGSEFWIFIIIIDLIVNDDYI